MDLKRKKQQINTLLGMLSTFLINDLQKKTWGDHKKCWDY